MNRHDLIFSCLIYRQKLRFLIMQSVQGLGKRVTGVFLDPAIIAVMSASLISPFFVPRINNVLDSVPILRDHKSLASLIAGIVVFGVAKIPKNTIISAVIVGVAGAFLLSAVLPLYTQVTNRGVGQ